MRLLFSGKKKQKSRRKPMKNDYSGKRHPEDRRTLVQRTTKGGGARAT